MNANVLTCITSPLTPLAGDSVTANIAFSLPQNAAPPASRTEVYPALHLDDMPNVSSASDFTILEAYIESTSSLSSDTKNTCTLVVKFTPWQTGAINLPPFVYLMPSSEKLQILPPPVTISSVFPNGVVGEELRPPLGVLLSPFTAHTLYALIAAAIVLFAAMCVTAVKWRAIRKKLLLYKMLRREKRNGKALKKRLAALSKSRADDSAFCTALQQAVRTYLGTRFGEDFSAMTTAEIANACMKRTFGIANGEAEEAYNSLIAVMQRTDFVRFCAKDAPDARLLLKERASLIKTVSNAAFTIRQPRV